MREKIEVYKEKIGGGDGDINLLSRTDQGGSTYEMEQFLGFRKYPSPALGPPPKPLKDTVFLASD